MISVYDMQPDRYRHTTIRCLKAPPPFTQLHSHCIAGSCVHESFVLAIGSLCGHSQSNL